MPAWLLLSLFGAEAMEAVEVGAVVVALGIYLYARNNGRTRGRR